MKTLTQNRRLLQEHVRGVYAMHATLSPNPLSEPTNDYSTPTTRIPFKPNSPFDSSMALTIVVLLTALFFMGFFLFYIHRLTNEESPELTRRSRPSRPLREENNQKGLDSATVKALPVFTYGGAAKQGIVEGCTICLSVFEEGEIVKLIPHCSHVFHPTCIDRWLASQVSCPLCRSTQILKKVNDKDEGRLDIIFERSTATSHGTCREMVGSGSTVRRSCSWPSLQGRDIVLHRSISL